MEQQLKRIIDLARVTGDRVIMTDREGREPVVVMGLDQYEALLGLDDYESSCLDFEDDPRGIDETLKRISIPTREELQEDQISEELQKAVDHDLKIIEEWEKEKNETGADNGIMEQVSPEDDMFHLEPVE